MKDDIETLREFITALADEAHLRWPGSADQAIAALERVKNSLKQTEEDFVRVCARASFAEIERDSLRAKLDEIEQSLTECGLPAELGNPSEPWPARDRIIGAYANYLRRHHEACKVDLENFALRTKLERAKELFASIRDYTNHGGTADRAQAALSELSADVPAQQTQISDEAVK